MADAIKWGKGRLAQATQFFDWELRFALQSRLSLERQWREWLEMYRAPAKQPVKKFPYEGASNIVLPVIATDVDQLYAKEMQTLHAPNNLWTCEAMNERWVDSAHPIHDALTWLDHNILKMQLVNERVNLEKYKLGTGIYKTSWIYEKRNVWTYDPRGKAVRVQRVVGQPQVDHVKCADFVLPPYSYAIDPDAQGGAPWVAERLRINVDRLRSLAFASEPFAPNWDPEAVNFILKFVEENQPLHDVKIQDLDYLKIGETRSPTLAFDRSDFESQKNLAGRYARKYDIELWEIHARFPTGGQGIGIDPSRPAQKDVDSQDDIVLWYHLPTRKVCRAIFNPYRHGKRPYEKVVMFPGEGFWGIGISEQKEVFQTLGSDLMNFTVDNVLLSNSVMLVAKAGANIVPGEPIYPGKIWIVDGDVRQDFNSMQMAQTYPNLPALAGQVQAMGERRTGISDIQLGNMQELPGRTPATTMMSLLQEGNRRPDLTIKMMREGLSNVGLRVVQLLQQYTGSPVDVGGKRLLTLMVQALGMPEGMFAAQKLTTPMEDASLGLGVSLTATSGSANKEVEKQNYVSLLQLAGQLTPQFIQLISVAQQSQGSPVGQVALQSALGLQELYRRLLEQYDIKNIADVAPDIAKDTQALQSGGQGPGAGGQGGGQLPGAMGAPAQPGGLAAPSSGAPQLGNVLDTFGSGR